VLLFVLVLLPILALVAQSFRLSGEGSVMPLGRLWRHGWGSLLLGSASAAVALVLGAGYSLLTVSAALPWPRLWRVLGLLPLAVPPYLVALAAIEAFGPRVGATPWLGGAVYSWWLCALVLGAVAMPLVCLPVGLALERLDGDLLAAARLARGRWGEVRILLALLRPSLSFGGTLAFAYSLVGFATPELLRVPVLTQLVYARFSGFRDLPGALSAALPLALVVGLVVWLVARGFESNQVAQVQPVSRVRWRLGGLGKTLAGFFALALLTPALLFPCGALLGTALASPEVAQQGVLALLRQALAVGAADALATFTAASGTALGAYIVALVVDRARLDLGIGRPWFFGVLGLAAVPAPILGIGLVLLWHHPLLEAIYDGPGILILAGLGRFLPLAVVLAAAASLRRDRRQDDAARLADRSALWLPGRLTEPLAIAALVYALSAGELGAAALVAPPDGTPLAVTLLNMVHFGRNAELAALSLLLLGIVLVPSALLLGLFLPPEEGNS